jgi:hypothetical protein
MERNAYRNIAILISITLVIFLPITWAHYFYTDDITLLWFYREGSIFHSLMEQGRTLTGIIAGSLISAIETIAQIKWLRLFSLLGWLLCVPLWYFVFDKVARKEGLHPMLPFFAVLYLVTSMPFAVSIMWASTMELFITNTCGLMAGYILYSSRSSLAFLPALALALVSLFTYQSGFGCFFLPFLLHLISKKKLTRTLLIAIGTYFLIFLLYYILFYLQLKTMHMDASQRAHLVSDPLLKLLWFLARPLASAFRFNWVVSEHSISGMIVYGLLLAAFVLMNVWPERSSSPGSLPRGKFLWSRLLYLAIILFLLVIIYLPNMVVNENYASNRTRLALNMAVFLLMFNSILQAIGTERYRQWMAGIIAIVLIFLAGYNLWIAFLKPVTQEYRLVRSYLEQQYHPGITTVVFIRPNEDMFHQKYGINSSSDEWGRPTTFPDCVPEPFVRQVIFERTGNRQTAERMIIDNWSDKNTWKKAGMSVPPNAILIDVESILR